jgi:hypothetical protein
LSRTTRRKKACRHRSYWDLQYALRDYDSDAVTPPQIDPKSKEGKRRIARYYADNYVRFKEPGPAWFRNLFTERPQRRKANAILHRVKQGEDIEVTLPAKERLDYWT